MAEAKNETSLEQMLEQHRGKPVPLPAHVDDIGGELLSILSKGLYTNPLDCLREYAQNAVDANANIVTIKITGNAVSIHDDGDGMDANDMRQARKVGHSPKSIAQHVGFRGIGLYSGFDICRELSIHSSKAGSPHVFTMVFKFANMKAQLDRERSQPPGGHRTSLVELLSKHTEIMMAGQEVTPDRHWTLVTLQDVSPEHVARLSDGSALRNYLLSNLPIAFAKEFPFATEINTHLRENVRGYRPIRVSLQLPGGLPELVEKYSADERRFDLSPPEFHELKGSKGEAIAYCWVSLNREPGSVDANRVSTKRGGETGTPQYAGLIYKMKGFSIGDRNKLRTFFDRRPQVYSWYTGEIYVTDPNVVPNAERNDFETSPAKQYLEAQFQTVAELLIRNADEFSARTTARKKIDEWTAEVEGVEKQFGPAGVDPSLGQSAVALETVRTLMDIIDDVQKRKRVKGLSTEYQDKAADLLHRAKRLRDQLDRQIKRPQAVAVGRKRRAAPGDFTGTPTTQPEVQQQAGILKDIFKEAGWSIEGEMGRCLDLFQEAIDDLMTGQRRLQAFSELSFREAIRADGHLRLKRCAPSRRLRTRTRCASCGTFPFFGHTVARSEND